MTIELVKTFLFNYRKGPLEVEEEKVNRLKEENNNT